MYSQSFPETEAMILKNCHGVSVAMRALLISLARRREAVAFAGPKQNGLFSPVISVTKGRQLPQVDSGSMLQFNDITTGGRGD